MEETGEVAMEEMVEDTLVVVDGEEMGVTVEALAVEALAEEVLEVEVLEDSFLVRELSLSVTHLSC